MGLRALVYEITPKGFLAGSSGDADTFANEVTSEHLDVDKAWHLIHYLLTGNTELKLFIEGQQLEFMEEFGEIHSPEATIQILEKLKFILATSELDGLNVDELNHKKIYPEKWGHELADWVLPHLTAMQEYVEKAVKRGYGLFVVIC